MNFTFKKILIACAPLLTAASVSAQSYSLQDIGLLVNVPARSDATVNGINSRTNLVGVGSFTNAYRAMFYGGAWTNLGTLGGIESYGLSVSDSGLVVGYSRTTNGYTHGFLWTPGGTNGVPSNPQMKDIGAFGGGTNSQAFDINSIGQISGYAETNVSDTIRDRAFRLNTNGTMTDIGRLLGNNTYSYGYGINDSGHVAGVVYNSSFAKGQAFLYNGTTAATIDSTATNASDSFALGINNDDQVVGYLTSGGFDHAFHYANGLMRDLGTLGGNYSYLFSINNSNVGVGASFVDPFDTIYHACAWFGDDLVDLNRELDSTGAGWTLTEARAINDAGQIVGIGNLTGTNRVFLLMPLPPFSAVPDPTLPLTRIDLAGDDIAISFASSNSVTYVLEYRTSLHLGKWNTLLQNIAGTGGEVTVTDVGSRFLKASRFYRVRTAGP